MKSRKKQFIAGAVCPSCSDVDSLVLYPDDQSIECVSCEYIQTSEQRDKQSTEESKSNTSASSKGKNHNEEARIDIINLN